jgi:ketosteroid isomerase-like protein
MRHGIFGLAILFFCACACAEETATKVDLKQQVIATERAFARTMADRDQAAFVSFISVEAVFLSEDRPLRGKQEIASRWQQYFQTPDAPFSWEPETVEVLDSGALALSTGPVRNAKGKLIGTFTSIWRLEEPATWRIVFDKGNCVCDQP